MEEREGRLNEGISPGKEAMGGEGVVLPDVTAGRLIQPT